MATLKNKSWDAIPGHRVEKPAPARATGKASDKAAKQVLGNGLPRRHKVESENLQSIGYRPQTKQLVVKFHASPSAYIFYDVPLEIYEGLNKAKSKGKFFAEHIREQFEVEIE